MVAFANFSIRDGLPTEQMTWPPKLKKLLNQWLGKKFFPTLFTMGQLQNILALRSLTQGFHSVLLQPKQSSWTTKALFWVCRNKWNWFLFLITMENFKSAVFKKYLQRLGDQHYAQPKVLSLTVPTQNLGTCYSLEELKELTSFARAHQLWIHIDGACFTMPCTTFKFLLPIFPTDSPATSFLPSVEQKMDGCLGNRIDFQAPDPYPIKFSVRCGVMNSTLENTLHCTLCTGLPSLSFKDLWKEIAEHSWLHGPTLLHQELQKFLDFISPTPAKQCCLSATSQLLTKVLRSRHFLYVWDEETFLSFDDELTTTAEKRVRLCRELCSHATKSVIDQSLVC